MYEKFFTTDNSVVEGIFVRRSDEYQNVIWFATQSLVQLSTLEHWFLACTDPNDELMFIGSNLI